MPPTSTINPITKHLDEPDIKLPPHRFAPCNVQTTRQRSATMLNNTPSTIGTQPVMRR